MAKLQRLVLFSQHFCIDPAHLAQVGAFDPSLNVDTNLFINPLLLTRSRAAQMKAAWHRYLKWFEDLGSLLKQCQKEEDTHWTRAYERLHFPEPPSTCLGQTVGGTRGSGIGDVIALNLVRSAYSLVKAGTTAAELMVCLPFLCEGLGPDRISDMVTQIIMQDLASYTQSALEGLVLPRTPLRDGSHSYQVPRYNGKPILLVPSDVLAKIKPGDVGTIVKVARRNKALRKRLSKRLEERIRVGANNWEGWVDGLIGLVRENDQEAIAVFHELVVETTSHYDWNADPDGHIPWRSALSIPRRQTIPIQAPSDPLARARLIIEQFGILLQEPAYARLLYLDARGKMPRSVVGLRRLFFAIAATQCKVDGDMLVEYDVDSELIAFLWRGAVILTVDVASSNDPNWRKRYQTVSPSGRLFVFVDFNRNKGAAALALMNKQRRRVAELAAEVQVVEPLRVTASGAIIRFVKCQLCGDNLLAERVSRHERESCKKRPELKTRR